MTAEQESLRASLPLWQALTVLKYLVAPPSCRASPMTSAATDAPPLSGLKCYAVEEVADQKVKTAFLKCGEVKLELLEPTSPESTIQKWLDKGNHGVHHVAFCIEDGVANALAECDEKGLRLIDKAPRKGAENLNIAFLHPKSTEGILTELCEH